jgi:hypothetical protein
VGNYVASFKDLGELYNDSKSNGWLLKRLVGTNNFELFDLLFLGSHAVSEVSFLFFMTTFIYFVTGLRDRLSQIGGDVSTHFIDTRDKLFVKKLSYFQLVVRKLKKLIGIYREIQGWVEVFLLVFITASHFMTIVLVHTMITTAMGDSDEKERLIFALGTMLGFSMLKIGVLIRLGEQLKNAVR